MEKFIEATIRKAKKDKTILAVAIFGSYARKEPYNDIDICLFLQPKDYPDLALSKKKINYASENKKYDVQVFQQLPLYIKKRILKDAKVLYCKNEDSLYDLYFKTLRDYSHFKYIYEDYLEMVAHG